MMTAKSLKRELLLSNQLNIPLSGNVENLHNMFSKIYVIDSNLSNNMVYFGYYVDNDKMILIHYNVVSKSVGVNQKIIWDIVNHYTNNYFETREVISYMINYFNLDIKHHPSDIIFVINFEWYRTMFGG